MNVYMFKKNCVLIALNNGLSPIWYQTIIWSNADHLIQNLEKNLSECNKISTLVWGLCQYDDAVLSV